MSSLIEAELIAMLRAEVIYNSKRAVADLVVTWQEL